MVGFRRHRVQDRWKQRCPALELSAHLVHLARQQGDLGLSARLGRLGAVGRQLTRAWPAAGSPSRPVKQADTDGSGHFPTPPGALWQASDRHAPGRQPLAIGHQLTGRHLVPRAGFCMGHDVTCQTARLAWSEVQHHPFTRFILCTSNEGHFTPCAILAVPPLTAPFFQPCCFRYLSTSLPQPSAFKFAALPAGSKSQHSAWPSRAGPLSVVLRVHGGTCPQPTASASCAQRVASLLLGRGPGTVHRP